MRVIRFDLTSRSISDWETPPAPPQTIRAVGGVVMRLTAMGGGIATGEVRSVGASAMSLSSAGRSRPPVVARSVGSAQMAALVAGTTRALQQIRAVGAAVSTMVVGGRRARASTDTLFALSFDGPALVDTGYYGIPVTLKSTAWRSNVDARFGDGCVQITRPFGGAYTSDGPYLGSIVFGSEGELAPPTALRRLFSAQSHDQMGAGIVGWTISGWMKVPTNGGGVALWVEYGGDNQYAPMEVRAVGLRAASDGKWEFFTAERHDGVHWTLATNTARSARQADIDTWVHFAISHGTDIRCYVDGVNDFESVRSLGGGVVERYDSLARMQDSGNLQNGLGRVYVGRDFEGRLDSISLVRGSLRNADFTPPAIPPVVGPSADGDGADVALLLHADGADGATEAVDASLYRHTVVLTGNTQIDTAQSKFGGASLRFDGSGGLEVPYNIVLDTVLDVTIEFWVLIDADQSNDTVPLFELTDTRHPYVGLESCAINMIRRTPGVGVWTIGMATNRGAGYMAIHKTANISLGTWHHVAITGGRRQAIYIDGVESLIVPGQDGLPFGWYWPHSLDWQQPIRIGMSRTGGPTFVGWMDEIRYRQGIQYAASFTPPAGPYLDPTES